MNIKMHLRMTQIAVSAIIILTVLLSFSAFADVNANVDEEGSETVTGNSSENTNSDVPINIESGSVTRITAVLSWNDGEDDGGPATRNEPDSFSLSITSPSGELSEEGSFSSSGSTSVSLSIPEDTMEEPGEWIITVYCGDCGDIYGPAGVVQVSSDTGNSWTLDVAYTTSEGEAGPVSYGPPAYVLEVLNHPIFKIHIALMISSTILFLLTGIVAGVYLFTRTTWARSNAPSLRKLATVKPFMVMAILVLIMFFIASVPIGMWVAGKYYGWANAWSGMPVFWNPDAYKMTNADNVSLITMVLWAIPLYLNRQTILRSPLFRKLFGWSKWMMKRADVAPAPVLTERELGFLYFVMGIFVFTVFAVQPHG